MPSSAITVVSKCAIFPEQKASVKSLRLSVSDLPMLSCQYIQKGVLLSSPPFSFADLICCLKRSLSATLSHFPPLAGRLSTDDDGYVYILCNDTGAEFIEAKAKHLSTKILLSPPDVPACFKGFFAYDRTLSFSGHFKPLLAVQVTELADGVFIGCTVNHAVTDGTSFWHFFNTFAEFSAGAKKISRSPNFCRNTVFDSLAVLQLPPGGPKVTFSIDHQLRERIFHFSRDAILKLKLRANNNNPIRKPVLSGNSDLVEIMGKQLNDGWENVKSESCPPNGKIDAFNRMAEISSFQSLCAQLWRSVTRARNLDIFKMTTFRMAVNCRHRIEPKLESHYFGNAIQSIPTTALAGEVVFQELSWSASLLHKNVVAHNDATVRGGVADWEKQPRLFPLGNFDGASMTMGSSPRFPMYGNDFGWGRPLAIRSGAANKFDGKMSAFPGREGNGSVDLEVVLSSDTMAALETDPEFMQYVSDRG